MSKIVDVYNPYDNQVVTKYYVDLVGKALESAGYQTNEVSTLDRKEGHEAIFVVYPYDCYLAHRKGYKNIILWIQGAGPEESYMRNKSKLRFYYLSFRERLGLRYADKIIMVSKRMREHYRQKYHMAFKENVFFMPCFNSELDPDCFYAEEKYTAQTFVYAGGLAAWQCFEQTAKLFSRIEQALPDARFDVYTSQKEEAERLIKKYGIKRYSIDFLTPEELSDRLKKAKYGFVLREDTEVNRVATPTKISSYAADGVIPIYSDCLQDFHEEVKGKKFFLSVDGDADSAENLEKILRHSRMQIDPAEIQAEYRELFGRYYHADYYIGTLRDFFLS